MFRPGVCGDVKIPISCLTIPILHVDRHVRLTPLMTSLPGCSHRERGRSERERGGSEREGGQRERGVREREGGQRERGWSERERGGHRE